jgi:hypothetical protein
MNDSSTVVVVVWSSAILMLVQASFFEEAAAIPKTSMILPMSMKSISGSSVPDGNSDELGFRLLRWDI